MVAGGHRGDRRERQRRGQRRAREGGASRRARELGQTHDAGVHLPGEHDSRRRSGGAVFAGERHRPARTADVRAASRACPTVARSANASAGEASGPDLGAPLDVRLAPDSIVLNDWTARELNAKAGDTATLEFYLWDAAAGLRTSTATFTVAGDRADDRTGRRSTARSGLPGHLRHRQPVGLGSAVPARPVAGPPAGRERTGDDHRTTPKAFIHYERARELWATRYGKLTGLRFARSRRAGTRTRWRKALRAQLRQRVAPVSQGMTLDAGAAARARGLARRDRFRRVLHLLQLLHRRLGAAARGAVLPARHRAAAAPDRRPARDRVYRASPPLDAVGRGGGDRARWRRGWRRRRHRLCARSSCYGLKTWWVGAVGTTLLELHVAPGEPRDRLRGRHDRVAALRGAVAAGGVAAESAALLGAHSIEQPAASDPRRSRRSARTVAARAGGLALMAAGFVRPRGAGRRILRAGAALLTAFLFVLSSWLRSRDARGHRRPRHLGGVAARLPRRGVPAGPERALGGAGRVGGVHHRVGRRVPPRRAESSPSDHASGTGGYVLLAQSEVPIVARSRQRGRPRGAARAVAGVRAGRLHALPARGRART